MNTAASGDPISRFVLLSTQRSGTSWFMDRVAKNPRVGGYGELLLPGVKGQPRWPPGAEDRPAFAVYLRDRSVRQPRVRSHYYLFHYLDYLYEPRRELQAIGFKLMYDQVRRNPEIVVYLRARRVRVIHLVRSNLLDIVLSREAMVKRRAPHASSEEKREDIQVELDTAHLVGALKRLEQQQQIARFTIRALRLDALEVTYESLLRDDAPLRGAVRFLGIADDRGLEVTSSLVKLARTSHRESIVNFAEVAARLRGTEYLRFLEGASDRAESSV